MSGLLSDWAEISKGSILGPLLFNIFLNNIFLFINKSNLCTYADDDTPYNLKKLKLDLQSNFSILPKLVLWFYKNHTVLNLGKSHYIFLGHTQIDYVHLNGIEIENSKKTLSGVILNNLMLISDYCAEGC